MAANTVHIPDPVMTIQSVRSGLDVYWKPGEIHEVRVLADRPEWFGFFDSQERAAAAILRHAKTPGVSFYMTANPVNPALLARASNTFKKPKLGLSTSDGDIVRRTRLVFDFDPRRPAGISATDQEVGAAQTCAAAAWKILDAQFKWPAAAAAIMSGNGTHLVWNLDLPNDDESRALLESVLRAADLLFSTEETSLDTGMFNASRIIKVPGTIARKGDDTPDRPHRLASVISRPKGSATLSRDHLLALAQIAPRMEPAFVNGHGPSGQPFDLEAFLSRTGVGYRGPLPISQGEKFVLDYCFFDESHNGTSAAVIRRPGGMLGYMCWHNSCRDRHWQDVRERYDGPRPRATSYQREESEASTNGFAERPNVDPNAEWPEPIPFTDERVQQLPANILPGILGEYSRALSRFTETPPELPILSVVGVMSVAAAGKIQIEAEPGYIEPANIYVCPVLESGNRKTAVVTSAVKPLVKYEIRERERLAPEIARLQSARKTKLAIVEKLRKGLKQADESAIRRIADLEADVPDVPHAPDIFTSDVTAERLEVLLEANGGRAAVISDEGGVFDVIAGRYNATPNLDVFLKGHCQAPLRVHRMGRTTLVDKPHLTVLLSPQPAVLSALRDKGFIRDRGLLARFLFALPQSPVGTRKLVPSCMSVRVTAEYEQLVTNILEWQPSEPVCLQLSPGAYREWKEFQHTVEAQMADGGLLCRLRDWGSKLSGAALRLAGLFHTARHADGLSVLSEEIQELEIQTALEICAALVSHAIAVFGIVSEDPALTKAKRLIRWLLEQNKDGITKRDCFRAHQPHVFEKVEEMESCLKILADHHLIRVTEKKTGGRSSEVFEINPTLREAK